MPPDGGIGTLVKVAVSEYIRYFNALKQGALPQPQATKEQVAQVAAAAIQRSMVMRQTTMTPVAVGEGQYDARFAAHRPSDGIRSKPRSHA